MKLFRLILFVCILVMSYAAQSVFNNRALSGLFGASTESAIAPLPGGRIFLFASTIPAAFGNFIGGSEALARLSPDELVTFGIFIVLISSIGFGLVASRWVPSTYRWIDGSKEARMYSPVGINRRPAAHGFGLIIMIFSIALIIIVTAQVSSFGLDTLVLQSIWIIGLALFLIGSILFGRRPRSDSPIPDDRALAPNPELNAKGALRIFLQGTGQPIDVRPLAGWRLLVVILLGATFLYLLQLLNIPARVDPIVADTGLQALSILRGESQTLFFPGITGLPMLAYIPSALAIQLSGHPLIGVRLAGVGAGLLMVIGTWLLACELFRRVPRYGKFGTLTEDDGRWVALLAALIVALSHVTLHFSRLPIFLGPVAWGTLGLWALLSGLRRQSPFSLAVSGMMIGLASVLYAGGLFFLLIAPIWWIGVWLLQRRWLSVDQGVGSRGLMLWLGGISAVLLPFLGVWNRLPQAFSSYMQSDLFLSPAVEARNQALLLSRGLDYLFLDNLRLTLFTFNIYPNNGVLFDLPSPFLNSWLAPLLFLGLGALVLNLDRLLGWLTIVTLISGFVLAAVSLNAPYWIRLLPLLPLVAITIAFALDRIRVILLETAGPWLEQTTVYLVLGLIAWAGLQGWLEYYNYALRQEATSSHIGRAIHAMDSTQTAVLFVSNSAVERFDANPKDSTSVPSEADEVMADDALTLPDASLIERIGLDTTVIDFLSSDMGGPKQRQEFLIGSWPAKEEMPIPSRVLILAENQAWIQEIENRYGKGQLTAIRNLRGDPILFLYDIWPTP